MTSTTPDLTVPAVEVAGPPAESLAGAVYNTPPVVGLDLSLTSTGVAIIERDRTVSVARVQSKGKADASLAARCRRLRHLRDDICDKVDVDGRVLVVVEGPSFGQARQVGQHDRAGLWWLVVEKLRWAGHDVVEVAPATLKRYATGRGNAGKDEVLAAVVRRYAADVVVTGNDVADALTLAAMGADWLGAPLATVPQNQRTALDKVDWPEGATS